MRVGMALIQVVCVVTGASGLEQKFIAALRTDMAKGSALMDVSAVASALMKTV